MKLLVVEDDPAIGKALQKGLTEAGHECSWLAESMPLDLVALGQQYDCILLDVMLPAGPSGLERLAAMRSLGDRTPVIIITAQGAVDQRIAGLQAGADDYLVKPFAIAELLARIEAVCRRTSLQQSSHMQAGALHLDLARRRVRIGNEAAELTPTECSLLEMLVRCAGNAVTRKMLCEHVWDCDWEGTTNVVEVHVNRLRGKLERLTPQPLIQTVRGRGYVLKPI